MHRCTRFREKCAWRAKFGKSKGWAAGGRFLGVSSLTGMPGMIYLLFAIATEVVGTTFLTISQGFRKPLPSIAAVVAWAISLFLLSRALQTMSVGAAYAIWAGVGTVLLTLIGLAVFKQRLDLPAALGMSLIVAGVIVLRLFSQVRLG